MRVRNWCFTQTCHILTLYLRLSPLAPVSINPWHCVMPSLFSPRSDRVNAADGAQCPALAGCWSALGSNKTFHTGQEPAPFPRLQLCVAASPVSSMRKPTGQLSKCRAGSWMIQHLTWVMAHLLDQVDQLGHFLLLLWALEGASPLGQAHLAPTSELTRVCNPCAPLKATHRRVHNVKRLSQGLLS